MALLIGLPVWYNQDNNQNSMCRKGDHSINGTKS